MLDPAPSAVLSAELKKEARQAAVFMDQRRNVHSMAWASMRGPAGAEPEQSCMPRRVSLAQPVTPYAVFLEHLSDSELTALAQRQQENHDRFREEWCGAGNPAPTTPPYDWPGFQEAVREARFMGIPIITV